MMNEADRHYLERRLREEKVRAVTAADPATRAAHRQMAEAYRQRLTSGDPNRLLIVPER